MNLTDAVSLLWQWFFPFPFQTKSPGIVRPCGKILWQTCLFTFVVGATVLCAWLVASAPPFHGWRFSDSSDSAADICYNESSDGNRFAKWWAHNRTGAVPQTFLEISRWDLKIEHLNRLGRGERIYSVHTEEPFCSFPHPTPTSFPTPFTPHLSQFRNRRVSDGFFFWPPEHLPGDRPFQFLKQKHAGYLPCANRLNNREKPPLMPHKEKLGQHMGLSHSSQMMAVCAS